MKKYLLLTLAVVGFTSFSYAAPQERISLHCGGNELPYAALLDINGKWGTIALMVDNYDTAQHSTPERDGTLGLKCQETGNSTECVGVWAWEHKPAKVVFTKDDAGNVSATFARSPYYGGEIVTLACVAHPPLFE
jgi:hypothetical protein